MTIRPAANEDLDTIWQIFHEVVAAGDTYSFELQMSREEALACWFAPKTQTFLAEEPGGGAVGTYILRPNHPGGDAHVASAALW